MSASYAMDKRRSNLNDIKLIAYDTTSVAYFVAALEQCIRTMSKK